MPIPRYSSKLSLRSFTANSILKAPQPKEAIILPSLSSGKVYTWGSGLSSKTGHGDYTTFNTPTLLDLPFPCTKIAHGISHSIALLDNGAAFCWGSNFYGQCDETDEVPKPLKVNLTPNHEPIKVTSTNFSSMILTSEGLVIPFGAGVLGRGNEYYDSNPLPIPFYKNRRIQRSVVDIDSGGDLVAVICNWKEVYIHGYIQGVNGEMSKCLSPCLVKHALTLCPRGFGAYSGSGSFAVLGKSLMNGAETLQIYGKRMKGNCAVPIVKETGWFKRMMAVRQDREKAEIDQMSRQTPGYPFMSGVKTFEDIYADEPILSLDIGELDVKQIVMGEEFCALLTGDGGVYTIDLASTTPRIVPFDLAQHDVKSVTVCGGGEKQTLKLVTVDELDRQCVISVKRNEEGFSEPVVDFVIEGGELIKEIDAGSDHFSIRT